MDVGQRVVQVAEMRDAQIGDLEHEDRVAVHARAAELADVGRHVAHVQVEIGDVVQRDLAALAPAAQHVGDVGVGERRCSGSNERCSS